MIDAYSSATALLAALRARRISAVELLALHLERIARLNPGLTAIAIANEEGARRQAAEADAALARGDTACPLLGLPLTVKDSIDVRGLPTTSGLPERAGSVAAETAPAAARLLQAGAVLLGKSNMPPNAGDWQSGNALFGLTRNPWDPAYTPGGSTGGGAAALAAGLTALELGTDVGGSIRLPAAFCGVYGHRPSDGLVPRQGVVPGSPLPNPAMTLNVIGPLARDAADLALALEVLAGPSGGEETAWSLRLPPARHAALAEFRVAMLPTEDWLPVDLEILAAQEELAAKLRALGARVHVAAPEGFSLYAHQELYSALGGAVVLAELPPEVRERVAAELRRSSDPLDQAEARGAGASLADYFALLERRERCRLGFARFFRDHDVLLAPIAPVPPFRHIPDQVPMGERSLDVAGRRIPYGRLWVYPGLATLPGLPATAFPCGRTRGGLPIGLQAVGPSLEDRTPLRFAALLAEAFGGFSPPPGFA